MLVGNNIEQAAYNISVQMHYWQTAALNLGSLLRIVAKCTGCNIYVHGKHVFFSITKHHWASYSNMA